MENNKIPKIIHYCWFGGKGKNKLIEKCINTWKKKLPDYEIIEWNEKNYNIKENPFAFFAYEKQMWAFVSDYVRLDVLSKYGGIYLDTDVEIIKSLDRFLEHKFFACFETNETKNDYLISTSILGSEKQHPIINLFRDYYHSIDLNNINLFKTPNTKIISKILVENYNLTLNNNIQVLKDDINIYSNEYFCPKNWLTKEQVFTNNTYAVHHFDGSWKNRNEKILIFFAGKIKGIFGENTYLALKKVKSYFNFLRRESGK